MMYAGDEHHTDDITSGFLEELDDYDADARLAQYDDDPNPYLGTYSEE